MSSAAGLDFFSSGGLPAPLVTSEEAERIAAAQFGLAAHARLLAAPSQVRVRARLAGAGR
jgi:hypothetical protein